MDAISDVSRGSEIFSSVPIFPPLPKPLNLDDLFGFSKAGRNKLVEVTVETKYFVPNKIFFSHVDSFTGKYIVSILSGADKKLQNHENSKEDTNQDEQKEKTIIEEKENTKKSFEKYHAQSVISSPCILMQDDNEKLEDVTNEEKCVYDTSKLTVAEYYDMMELDSSESRSEFLKDKLGKYNIKSTEVDLVKSELDPLFHHKTPISDDQETEFKIIGTLKNPDSEDIEGVSEIIRTTYDDPEFLNQLVTCGIIIYCINENLDQTPEATWVLNYIISFINEMRKNQYPTSFCSPIFLLVSTFMTWSLTKLLSFDEDLPFIEKDYRKRKPHPNYKTLYELEELLIKAKFDHRIKSVIIVSGIPYGHEENELRFLFDKAYYYKHLPIYSKGTNLVPLVHVENLGQIVKETIRRIDHVTTPFIFAKDPVQNTMRDITEAISLSLGTGYCEFQCKEVAFINDMISQHVYDKFTNKLLLESSYPLFKEEDINWKYEWGFTENINHIVKEFVVAVKNKPLRIIFYGGSQNDRLKSIAQNISKNYNIPYINPQNTIYEYCAEVLEKKTKFLEQRQRSINSNRDNSPLELIICGDEKYIENEVEILKKFNIHTANDAKLLQESAQASILARRLKLRPYIYQGFIMEDYPHSLDEANLFFENRADMFDIDSPDNTSILPDIVILFNELKDIKNQSQNVFYMEQENEENNLRTSSALKLLEGQLENYEEHASISADLNILEENNTTASGIESTVETINAIKHESIFSFFTKVDKRCLAVKLNFSESDDEDNIFNKTMRVIQKNYFFQDQCIVSSSSINEENQSTQNISDEENKIMAQHSNVEEGVEDYDTEGLKETEEITLAVRSYHLISYLINFISPTLTNGILEVTALMDQDPIDFLAEYIFKNNPDGRMMPQNESKLEELMRSQKKPVQKIDSKACLS